MAMNPPEKKLESLAPITGEQRAQSEPFGSWRLLTAHRFAAQSSPATFPMYGCS